MTPNTPELWMLFGDDESSERINALYWIEGELDYALSGELAREELAAMVTSSYKQHADM